MKGLKTLKPRAARIVALGVFHVVDRLKKMSKLCSCPIGHRKEGDMIVMSVLFFCFFVVDHLREMNRSTKLEGNSRQTLLVQLRLIPSLKGAQDFGSCIRSSRRLDAVKDGTGEYSL